MWWIIGLLLVITVVIVVTMCIGAKFAEEDYVFGYQNLMDFYFKKGFSISRLKAHADTECDLDIKSGLDDAIDVLESFGFPDTYDGEYLP